MTDQTAEDRRTAHAQRYRATLALLDGRAAQQRAKQAARERAAYMFGVKLAYVIGGLALAWLVFSILSMMG